VNVAARLEQAAAPGETLLGESTHRLVREAVSTQAIEPIAGKGKSEPVAAFRLTGLVEGAEFIPRRLDSPLVGRENELHVLATRRDRAPLGGDRFRGESGRDRAPAEEMLREAHRILTDVGERGYLSTVSALLARALVLQGRHEEAEVFADKARQVGAEDDVMTQLDWRAAKAHVVAARGEREEAARLAAEIVELVPARESLDMPVALVDVAEFLEPDAQRAALEQALVVASAKGNAITAGEVRARLAALPSRPQ
jgi:hypothetical protein